MVSLNDSHVCTPCPDCGAPATAVTLRVGEHPLRFFACAHCVVEIDGLECPKCFALDDQGRVVAHH